ncbi:chromosome segregation protein SMC [Thalassotalea maritima]|uniref:chromosome segregation protein SMC n=1 Tax=Thalassotalea maritima TaxID=3242416 RepID=UPI0035293597
MRLKKIKLAGFKSFVDVTHVPFEQDMTAIVGPNGCGKSNIIDAVRWVLGESSAKNLRGDAMTDVIFNGSSARKPVGQASVELVFDNSDNSLSGSMADRSEVSIRRTVNRDAQNTYYLNGSKCRRKDITDIFLGTGLGPRSYAIIEQGMISRLIESKPQELRVFIEEAAGISKYKERRKETENRIRHTRDNLVRLADIRQELAVNLEKLHGQSQAAIRYKALKADERNVKAELAAIRFQHCQQKLDSLAKQQSQQKNILEQLLAQQRAAERHIVDARVKQDDGSEKLNQLTQQKLQLTSAIAGLEQRIEHNKQQRTRLQKTIERHQQERAQLKEHMQSVDNVRHSATALLEKLSPELEKQQQLARNISDELDDVITRQQAWQQHWDTLQTLHASFQQNVSINRTHIESTQQLMAKTEQRIEQLRGQVNDNKHQALQQQLTNMSNEQQDIAMQLATLQDGVDQIDDGVEQQQLAVTEQQQQVAKLTQQIQQCQARYDALVTVTETQNDWQKHQSQWLTRAGQQSLTTLLQQLDVEPGWETAVEMVLGHWLQAHLVSENVDVSGVVTDLAQGMLIIETQQANQAERLDDTSSLLSKIANAQSLTALFAHIRIVDDVAELMQKRQTLTAEQSLICAEGIWAGKGWLRKGILADADATQPDLLQRKAKLRAIEQQLGLLEPQHTQAQQRLDHSEETLHTLQAEQRQLVQRLQQQQLQQQQHHHQQQLLAQQYQQTQSDYQHVKAQLASQESLYQQELSRYQQLLEQQQQLDKDRQADPHARQQLIEQRDALQQQYRQYQQQQREITEQLQQLRLQQQKAEHDLSNAEQTWQREQQRLTQLDDQSTRYQQQLHDSQRPLAEQQQALQQLLTQTSELDKQQGAIHQRVQQSNNDIDNFNRQQHSLMQDITAAQQQLQQLVVDSENHKVRATTAKEQLVELRQSLPDVIARLASHATESQWQVKLATISKQISKLGAINLAAIDEFEAQSQRKQFLDSQHNDLEQALETLEGAIAKIDRQTKQQFKQTFDQVNNDLKYLFPKVFDGGSAYLELTGDDLLDTGVSIMARPPGKKNSTIALLSGGEKALTALSLVFAIFRLNPAPFCMLDEVDAPLDDANVGRFCKLVKEMSQTVQFIYISHNKIAMEMASHLTGVTMHEPGVSRMVAVDIDEAVAMAEAG